MPVEVIHDLRSAFGPVIDQGQRATCLATAVSDAHRRAIPLKEALSAEYLYYHAVRRTLERDPGLGISIPELNQALLRDGQPLDAFWPYSSRLETERPGGWRPPAGHPERLWHGEAVPRAVDPAFVHREVAAGRPIILALTTTESFYRPGKDGVVDANPKSRSVGPHVVLAVGTGKRYGASFVLVRNSWGPSWGMEGHAWLEDQYVFRQAQCLAVVEHRYMS